MGNEKIKVLLIEDSPLAANMIKGMLSEGRGGNIALENIDNVSAARTRLDAGDVDAILLDLNLPDSNGLDTFLSIHSKAPRTPIIILTGLSDEALAITAISKGAQDYLVKGQIDPDILVREVNYALERKKIELALEKAYTDLKIAQDKLVQSEKMAGIGRFSEMIAHEVKNPLGIIIMGSEFLSAKLEGADEATKSSIEKVFAAAVRANKILESFLIYAEAPKITTARMSASDVVAETLASFKRAANLSKIKLITDVSKEDMCVDVDRGQIDQAIFNILTNAAEAMPYGGTITVKVGTVSVPDVASGKPSCLIEIVDTGAGIAKENLSKVFEPFFTTKVRTVAKGLGLFLAKTAADVHKGKLTLDSVPGRGTDVKLILPCCQR